MNTWELITKTTAGENKYYYFMCWRAIRNPQQAVKYGYAPDGVRLEIAENDETPIKVTLLSPWKYFVKKFMKRG